MTTRLADLYSRNTPQRTRARADQVQNSASGYVFKVDDWDLLDRFLILGSEGGTFYIAPRELTREHAQNVVKLIHEDGPRVVSRIVEISKAGRAARNDPALFALALCVAEGDEMTRMYAYSAIPEVCRIGTHLFHFADYLKAVGKGWSRGVRNAVARWYVDMSTDKLGYQALKYKQRDGWNHANLLALSHAKADDVVRNAIFKWIVMPTVKDDAPTRKLGDGTVIEVENPLTREQKLANIEEYVQKHAPAQVLAAHSLSDESKSAEVVKAILDHDLPREAIPTKFLRNVEVWDALLQKMPITALVRNLGKMTNVGLLTPMSDASKLVNQKLGNVEAVRKSRLHPMQVLYALKTYGQGGGFRGKLTWEPVQSVMSSLDDLFYTTFGNVEPTGKRTLIGIDVSGSMSCPIMHEAPVTCAEGAAAMAMVTARVEDPDSYAIMGFNQGLQKLPISPKMSFGEVLRKTSNVNFGGTDCSLPMLYAMKNGMKVDTFCVYTDSETWAGTVQPFEALNEYRRRTGIPAKLVVVGMASNGFTIADPRDPGMMDVVGFDAGAPAIISDFARAEMTA